MADSKFDRQLKNLLKGDDDLEKELDNMPDEGEEEEEQVQDMSPVIFEPKESSVDIFRNKDAEDDYKFARSNLYGLIGRSNAALELTLKIAAMSEHPRAMEVASTIMKTSADMTKQLLELQKSIEEQEKGKKGNAPSGHYEQHNHYYGKDGDKSPKDIDGELDGLDDEK